MASKIYTDEVRVKPPRNQLVSKEKKMTDQKQYSRRLVLWGNKIIEAESQIK